MNVRCIQVEGDKNCNRKICKNAKQVHHISSQLTFSDFAWTDRVPVCVDDGFQGIRSSVDGFPHHSVQVFRTKTIILNRTIVFGSHIFISLESKFFKCWLPTIANYFKFWVEWQTWAKNKLHIIYIVYSSLLNEYLQQTVKDQKFVPILGGNL